MLYHGYLKLTCPFKRTDCAKILMGSPKEMTICTKQFMLLFIYEVMSVGVELYLEYDTTYSD